MNPPERGRLVVAAPILSDPNFARTVVLLLSHDEGGSLGVILNRPSELPVAEIVPSWALHASPPGVLFSGGPVQQNAAICVGLAADGQIAADGSLVDLDGYSPLTETMGTVDLHREPEDVAISFEGLRVFKGYAGWGPGQLAEEIEQDAWYVLEASPSEILTPEPEGLWQRVLSAQGGWLSVLARHPVDPSLN